MKKFLLAATLVSLAVGGKGSAHEFWIDPASYGVAPGETVTAQLRVGQDFVGTPMSYLPRNFERFEVIAGGDIFEVQGRFGDIPALSIHGLPDGLAVVVHETTSRDLTWTTWDRFLGFAEHKDLGDVTTMQAERGLDQDDVRETYYRYAKSLIAVGAGAGSDTRVGMLTELVALANPYTDDVSGGVPVQLWLNDAVRANEQVELFDQAPDGTVTITTHRTDADGIAILPVQPGHIYMADAVTLEPVDPRLPNDAEWLTHWANLTFAVP